MLMGGFLPRSISLPVTETLPPFGDRQSHTCPGGRCQGQTLIHTVPVSFGRVT
jgi:hypothetical protein